MEKNCWDIDDVFNNKQTLDFSKKFLPESFVGHTFNKDSETTQQQALTLNHILTHSYVHFFYFIEEFIVSKTNQLSYLSSDNSAEQALSNFSTEEIKHQLLFIRVKDRIAKGLHCAPLVVNMEKETAKQLMEVSDIAALLFILHLEIITQEHYLYSIRDQENIDKTMKSILKHHWIEESQHTKLDFLQLQKVVEDKTKDELKKGIAEYYTCLEKLKFVFEMQSKLDIESFESIAKVSLSSDNVKALAENQFNTYFNIFVRQGIENSFFHQAIDTIFSDLRADFNHYNEKYQL